MAEEKVFNCGYERVEPEASKRDQSRGESGGLDIATRLSWEGLGESEKERGKEGEGKQNRRGAEEPEELGGQRESGNHKAEMAELYRKEKLGQGKGREVPGLKRFRVGEGVKRVERSQGNWGNLVANMCFGVLIGTWVNHLPRISFGSDRILLARAVPSRWLTFRTKAPALIRRQTFISWLHG